MSETRSCGNCQSFLPMRGKDSEYGMCCNMLSVFDGCYVYIEKPGCIQYCEVKK